MGLPTYMTHNPTSKTCILAVTGAFDTGGGIAAVNRLMIQVLSEIGYEIWLFTLNEGDASKSQYAQFPGLHFSGMAGNKLKFGLAVWQNVLGQHHDLIMVDHVNLASVLTPLAFFRIIR